MATRTAGVIYVLAFFAADRKPGLAKALLVGGAGIQLASAIVTGLVINSDVPGRGPVAVFFDIFPAILALAAAFLIGPAPSGVEEPPAQIAWQEDLGPSAEPDVARLGDGRQGLPKSPPVIFAGVILLLLSLFLMAVSFTALLNRAS